jgi:hypothetical protein
MEIYRDTTRTCTDCGAPFTWRAADQKFHAERGYFPPKRCPGCRQRHRQERERQTQ